MFIATYRNTIKSLLRSVTFWLVAFIFCFIVLPYMSGNQQTPNAMFITLNYWGKSSPSELYVQYVDNLICAKILLYSLPIFSIILAALTLSSDYGDGFYEIEKARGIRPSCYILGRISAISAVTLVLSAVVSFICVYGHVIMSGGVTDHSVSWLLVDSVLRVGAYHLFIVLPNVLFHVGLTYLFGTLLQNGLAGAGVGFVHVIVYFIINMLYQYLYDFRTYFDYLSPIPKQLRYFLRFFVEVEGRAEFLRMSGAEFLRMNGTTAPKALICVGFLLGCAALFLLCSWLRLRKREI